jgi:hypothetical protein
MSANNKDPDTERFQWKLRFFASIDLVGSTAYKQRCRLSDDEVAWALSFQQFYSWFSGRLSSNPVLSPVEVSPLTSWKTLGDEILFYADITNHCEVIVHLQNLRQAICSYNQLDKSHTMPCKATAWLGGFPVNNWTVYDNKNTPSDFIGTSIDCGFRLTKLSTPRKIAISIDLALMIADYYENSPTDQNHLKIHYDGKQELKGVLGGIPYPIFWIDADYAFIIEDNLLGKNYCTTKDMKLFCDNYFSSNSASLNRPFIENDPKYNYIPEEIHRQREKLISTW